MKLLIFLLGLAVAHATINITPTYKDTRVLHTYQDVSKSFIYRYEAFINTTLPQSGVDFIGQKIVCDVELNVLTSEIIHMNLTNVIVQEVNGTYNATLRERGILYPVNVTVINSSLTQNYTRELRNPVTFQYVNGKIVRVFANRTDPEWVVNMKKGIMNMLVLQLENEDVFTKKEEGISGTCETQYFINERRTDDNVRIYNITKVRDLTNCTDTPYLMFKTDDLKTKDCVEPECDKEKTQPIKAIATFKYNVTGNRRNVFIESCTSNARYVLSPRLDVESGSFMVIQNQSLVLKEVKSRKIKPLPELTQRGDIKFVFPEIVNDVDRWNTTLKKVEYFASLLSVQTRTNLTIETPSHFLHLVRSLRECNITQLRQVWNWTQRTTNVTNTWIIKALPYVNKTDMTQLVKELFLNRTINITRDGEELLLGLGNVQKPTIQMIQDIKEVCRCDVLQEPTKEMERWNVTKITNVRRACWVSYGNMIYRFKKAERFVPSTIVRSLTDCQDTWNYPKLDEVKISKDMYKMLIEIRKNEIKLQCIEAMGNAGLPDHTNILRDTILDKTLPVDLRIAAVTSLRRIGKETDKKVISIILPILRNPTEDPELRVICYRTLLECKPTPAILTLIADGINTWTDIEVRTFIWTHLRNLAKSQNPWEKELSRAARYALLTVRRPFNITYKQSQNRWIEIFTEDKTSGAKCELDTVFSKQNIIPRRINAKCDLSVVGQYFNLMELNLHTDSLNDVLDRIFGTHGSWSKRKNIFDMLKQKKTTEVVDYTKDELNKLKLKVSPYTKVTKRHANAQFKMFETETWYQALDDTFFEDIMDVGKLSTKMVDIEKELMKPQRLNFTKAQVFEILQQFPTVVGLPLSYNATSSTIIRVKVNTSFVAQPSLQDVTHTDLVAKVNVTPEVMWVSMQQFGCVTPLNKIIGEANNTVNMTLPLTTRVIVDYDTKKYSVEFDHLKQDRLDILTVRHNISLIHEKVRCAKCQIFRRNITVFNATQIGNPVNTTMCFQPYEDSMQLCLNYTTTKRTGRTGLMWSSLRPQSKFEIFAKKGTFTPDKVVVEYQPVGVEDWERVKTLDAKIRFAVEKPSERPDFVERSLNTRITLTNQEDRVVIGGEITKTEDNTWRAVIDGEQNPEGDIILDFNWGRENSRIITLNRTVDKQVEREFFIRFISDRWILPTQIVHNATLLWDNTPQWCKTVGRTYLDYVPEMKYWLVKTLTTWEPRIEPKRNWIENSFQVCMKTKTNDTIDLFLVMQDRELSIRNIPTPVPSRFLEKPLPKIIKSIIKPNITLIPKPTVCSIGSKGLFRTFDNVTYNYTMPGACPHVVARDCSSDERFTVLLQNITLREERNTVLTGLKAIVYVSKNKVELSQILDTDLNTRVLELKVNGRSELNNWQYKPELDIENTNTTIKRNATHITLISEQGLTVVMSVDEVKINVTHRHWNTTCGLCGNNDGERVSEFRSPWTEKPTHFTNATKFGLSWLAQGEDCKDEQCTLKKYASLPINRITDEAIEIGEEPAACFSTEPVFYCPKECTPVPRHEVFPFSDYEAERITVKVGFYCYKTTDPQIQYQKSTDLLYSEKTPDIFKEIDIPNKCSCLDTCLDTKKKW